MPNTKVNSTTCDIIISCDHSQTNFSKNNQGLAKPEIIQDYGNSVLADMLSM